MSYSFQRSPSPTPSCCISISAYIITSATFFALAHEACMQTFGILHTISLLARVSSPTPFHELCEPRLGISAWRSLLHYLDPCPVASFQAHARRDTALRGESKAPIISRSRMCSRTSQNEVSMMMARAKCGPSHRRTVLAVFAVASSWAPIGWMTQFLHYGATRPSGTRTTTVVTCQR